LKTSLIALFLIATLSGALFFLSIHTLRLQSEYEKLQHEWRELIKLRDLKIDRNLALRSLREKVSVEIITLKGSKYVRIPDVNQWHTRIIVENEHMIIIGMEDWESPNSPLVDYTDIVFIIRADGSMSVHCRGSYGKIVYLQGKVIYAYSKARAPKPTLSKLW
jgi:hypothetical protein